MPAASRRQAEGLTDARGVAALKTAMTAWIDSAKLGPVDFADRFFGREPGDPIVVRLREGARLAATAQS